MLDHHRKLLHAEGDFGAGSMDELCYLHSARMSRECPHRFLPDSHRLHGAVWSAANYRYFPEQSNCAKSADGRRQHGWEVCAARFPCTIHPQVHHGGCLRASFWPSQIAIWRRWHDSEIFRDAIRWDENHHFSPPPSFIGAPWLHL